MSYKISRPIKNSIRWIYYRSILSYHYLEIYYVILLRYLRIGSFGNLKEEQFFAPEEFHQPSRIWVEKARVELGIDVDFIEVDPTQELQLNFPKTIYPDIRTQFHETANSQLESTFILMIPEGRVWGQYGAVITPDNKLLMDVSEYYFYKIQKKHIALLSWRLVPLEIFDETVAVLSIDASNIYYHWMFHALPRLELLRRSGLDMAQIDKFVVSSRQKSYQKETLDRLGITEERSIESSKFQHIKAKKLIVPSIPISKCLSPKWACDFLRNSFLPQDGFIKQKQRSYISRGKASYRRIINEDEVIDFLSNRGFEIVIFENLSVAEQAICMASSEVVIGPHGSGLTNIVFCSPGTKIVEIFSPELVHFHYWKISEVVGLEYYYILGKGNRNPDYQQEWNPFANIEVDLDELKQVLDRANI